MLVSVVVAVGVQVVGTLLVGALVIVPAAAKTLVTNLTRYAAPGAVFGVVSSLGGTALSCAWGTAAGPLVVVLGVSVFPSSWGFAEVRHRRVGDADSARPVGRN